MLYWGQKLEEKNCFAWNVRWNFSAPFFPPTSYIMNSSGPYLPHSPHTTWKGTLATRCFRPSLDVSPSTFATGATIRWTGWPTGWTEQKLFSIPQPRWGPSGWPQLFLVQLIVFAFDFDSLLQWANVADRSSECSHCKHLLHRLQQPCGDGEKRMITLCLEGCVSGSIHMHLHILCMCITTIIFSIKSFSISLSQQR